MPKQVIFALLIETALILLTTILLTQPGTIFSGQSERFRSTAMMGGLLLLCITFIWSVVFGAVLTLNTLTFRI